MLATARLWNKFGYLTERASQLRHGVILDHLLPKILYIQNCHLDKSLAEKLPASNSGNTHHL